MEHMKTCQRCADELASYQTALGALNQPVEKYEIPAALDHLDLREHRNRLSWYRYALSAAVAVILIAAALFILHWGDRSTRVTVKDDGKPEHVVKMPEKDKPIQHVRPTPDKTADITAPTKKRQSTTRHRVAYKHNKQRITPNPRSEEVDPKHIAMNKDEAPDQTLPAPTGVIVIATMIQPSSIEIESTDHNTGMVSTYCVTSDDTGAEQVTQTITNNETQDRR